jgi:hypothetical protein
MPSSSTETPPVSEKLFQSADIFLCAFLLTQGIELNHVERLPGTQKCTFFFKKNSEAEISELVRMYWSNEPISIVPSRLLHSLRHLKAMIYKLS